MSLITTAYACDRKTLAAAAIVRAARANPAITADGLLDEVEREETQGWAAIIDRYSLSFSEWSGAMESAAEILAAR